MSVAIIVHKFESFKKLLEVVASLRFRKLATKSNKVEQLTTANELKYDELDVLAALLRVDLVTLVHLHETDDIGVMEVRQSSHLCVDQFFK